MATTNPMMVFSGEYALTGGPRTRQTGPRRTAPTTTPKRDPCADTRTALLPRPLFASLCAGRTEIVSPEGIPRYVDTIASENMCDTRALTRKHATISVGTPSPAEPPSIAKNAATDVEPATTTAARLFT